MSHVRWLVALGLSAALSLSAHADGDIEWRHRATQGAVTLMANALGTASRTSFYTARGFSETAIRAYAQACGFSFGMQNGGATTLTTRLADWNAVGAGGKRISLRLPQSWDADWEKAGVPQAARIAFRWAQFQAENTFEPGDWIMGMATLEAPLPGPFRLVARYLDEEGSHEIVLDGLTCIGN
jgi:hypothetical protein